MSHQELKQKLVEHLLFKYELGKQDYGSLKRLSELLKSKFNATVSVNTLARVAGIKAEVRNHYSHTLDVLARIAGFENYLHYCSVFNGKKNISNSNFYFSQPSFFYEYSRSAAIKNDERYFTHLAEYLNQNGCSWAVSLELGLAISSGLRVNPNADKIIPVLVNHPVYLDHCFETYVDIDYLAQYYGKAMKKLSSCAKEGTRTWLFANCMKMNFEKINQKVSGYHKTGEMLTALHFGEMDNLIHQGIIFPVARWIHAVTEFCISTSNQNYLVDCWNWLDSKWSILNPDQQIVFISLLSDLSEKLTKLMNSDLIHKFQLIKNKVQFEKDSLYNAGLNLSILENKKLISLSTIRNALSSNHAQLYTCRNSLQSKLDKARHLYL